MNKQSLRLRLKQSLVLRTKELRKTQKNHNSYFVIHNSGKSFGFTMLELIMVMSILSVIAGLFLATYPASQRRARDTQRKSDIKQYQTAVEVFGNKNEGLYPRRSAGAGQPADTTLCSDLNFASGECPSDPKDSTTGCDGNTCEYRYQSNNGCGSAGDPCAVRYVLWGALEQPDNSGNSVYWTVCSNGRSGEISSGIPPSDGNCPI